MELGTLELSRLCKTISQKAQRKRLTWQAVTLLIRLLFFDQIFFHYEDFSGIEIWCGFLENNCQRNKLPLDLAKSISFKLFCFDTWDHKNNITSCLYPTSDLPHYYFSHTIVASALSICSFSFVQLTRGEERIKQDVVNKCHRYCWLKVQESSVNSAFFEEVRKFWVGFTMVVYEKTYLEAYKITNTFVSKNNTTKLYFTLGRVGLCWKFFHLRMNLVLPDFPTGSGSYLCINEIVKENLTYNHFKTSKSLIFLTFLQKRNNTLLLQPLLYVLHYVSTLNYYFYIVLETYFFI